MFRLISTSAQLGIRPAILLKVRSNTGTLAISSASNNLASQNAAQYLPAQFARSNSQSSVNTNLSTKYSRVDSFIAKAQKDPLLRDIIDQETKVKINHFQEQLSLASQYRTHKDREGQRAFVDTMANIFNLFKDDNLRSAFSSKDLFHFVQMLNFSVYHNRTSRLSGSKNRDSDQYQNENLIDEVLLKNAVLIASETIIEGEFNKILNANILLFLFFSMGQFQLYPEMINLWENGVNDPNIGKLYLDEKILAVILPIAYNSKRFDYEEILHIYELNTKENTNIHHELLSSMGKIAIRAGDYSRGLDSLEALLQAYESNTKDKKKVLGSLGDLHLSFIGACKDIKISKHFFDKVIQYDLPYFVRLKVPHIQSLLENCYELNEGIDEILYFWRSTVSHYNNEKKNLLLNSRYSILNNTLFQIFFKMYPTMTEESIDKLKEIISSYSDIKTVDEVFLNTIIGNYSWGNKEILEQLMENYEIYGVKRTPVSYRICLKKTGELSSYSNEDILSKWNQALKHLDETKFNYIPIADWAALRDATILSPFSDERKNFYLSVLDKYKDYIQDQRSCIRFVRYWMRKPEHFKEIAKLSESIQSDQNESYKIDVPQFSHLKPNINYKEMSSKIIQR